METKMVRFYEDSDPSNPHELIGILVNNEYVICGECGSVFDADEVEILEMMNWVDFSSPILRGRE